MKDLRHVARMRIPWGVVIVAAIVGPWYVAASLEGQYAFGVLIRISILRFFSTWFHKQPWYYHVAGLPWTFFPWSFFLPGAVHLAVSSRSSRPAMKFILVWATSLLVFFSLSDGKRHQYLLTMCPALALLVGYLGHRAVGEWNDRYFRRAISTPSASLAAFLGLLGVGLLVGARLRLEQYFATAAFYAVLSLVFAVLIALAVRKARPERQLMLPAAFMAVLTVSGLYLVITVLERYKSPHPICEDIVRQLDRGAEWASYKFYRAALVYYADGFMKVLATEDALHEFLDRPVHTVVLMRAEDYERLRDTAARAGQVVARESIGDGDFAVVSNREKP